MRACFPKLFSSLSTSERVWHVFSFAEPRSAAAEPSAQPDGPQPVQKVPTPTEAFYSRLIPALKVPRRAPNQD